jgi:hypothetical protein
LWPVTIEIQNNLVTILIKGTVSLQIPDEGGGRIHMMYIRAQVSVVAALMEGYTKKIIGLRKNNGSDEDNFFGDIVLGTEKLK